MKAEKHYSDVWWLLRLGLGGTTFLAGLDKFTDVMTDWDKYVAPAAEQALPVDRKRFMRLVGVVEMAVGAGILVRPTRMSSYVAALWLLGIAGNLAIHDEKYLDIAARDVNLALAAYALGRLTGDRQSRAPRAEEPLSEPEEVRANVRRGLHLIGGGRGGRGTEQERQRRKAA